MAIVAAYIDVKTISKKIVFDLIRLWVIRRIVISRSTVIKILYNQIYFVEKYNNPIIILFGTKIYQLINQSDTIII